MNKKATVLTLAIALAAVPNLGWAKIFDCRTLDGEIDVPVEAQTVQEAEAQTRADNKLDDSVVIKCREAEE